MKELLLFCITILLWACYEPTGKVVNRRNFSKEFFEEEFRSILVGCDLQNQKVKLKNTKWLKIEKELQRNDSTFVLAKGKKITLTERQFKHDIFLEKVENDAWMFRYNSTSRDTTDSGTLTITKDKGRVVCKCDYLIN